ncbi:MAG: hypothetical protein WA632_12345 [Gallionella sp.]
MQARLFGSLIALLLLAGCDRITGEADKKILDAQAVGYACRVSLKTPEDCMKENEAQSPTHILSGWKSADQDINERVLDPTMGKRTVKIEAKPAATPPPENKAAPENTAAPSEKKPANSGH